MREIMEKALKKSSADYADIRLEDVDGSNITFRGKELDNISHEKTTGGIVRALYKGGWGFSSFNDPGDLNACVKEACESARMAGNDVSRLAGTDPVTDIIKAEMKNDFREIPISEKKKLIEEYNNIIHGYSGKITASTVHYNDSFRKIYYSNSEGTYIEDERPDIMAYLSAAAREGNNVQEAYEVAGSLQEYGDIAGLHEKAESVAARAVDLLSASPVKGGKYTVILDPCLAGTFAHEAFGHLSEADFIYENEQLKNMMVLGKRFGSSILNIIDDGSAPGRHGTHKYDDEGVKTRKNYLIKNGILTGRLHSRETAGKMGEQPTGNARAASYNDEPIVRMTNTYIDKGSSTFNDMIKGIKTGIYAIGMNGGLTEFEMFTFSAAYGYMIRDGKVAELVRDIVFSGNLFETMMNIDMIGDQIIWESAAMCGKLFQLIPVGCGSPHIRIRKLMTGGEQ